MSIRVRNWRDQAPYVGHISALVWTLYQSHDKDETSPPDVNRLHGINSFVKHGLQGHQHSDHHSHDSIEQLYFILRGRGQLTIGDDKVDVRDGTAVYMPVNVPHQAFNDGEGWMEHLIVSCPLDEIREGTSAVRDWRDVHPVVLEDGTVSWPLLLREEEAPAGEGGVLQRVHSVTRYAVQGRRETDWQELDGIELVHYVISGYGTIEELDDNQQLLTEGSAAHVLPGEAHRFVNQGEGWFEYVTFAVEIGEIEVPDESDQDEDSDETAVQAGEAAAAAATVLTDVDWDEADAVETEEEIEESVNSDAAEEDVDVDEAEAAVEVEDDDSGEIEAAAEAAVEVEDDDSGEIEAAAEAAVEVEDDDSGEIEAAADEADEDAGDEDAGDAEEDDDSGEIEAAADEADAVEDDNAEEDTDAVEDDDAVVEDLADTGEDLTDTGEDQEEDDEVDDAGVAEIGNDAVEDDDAEVEDLTDSGEDQEEDDDVDDAGVAEIGDDAVEDDDAVVEDLTDSGEDQEDAENASVVAEEVDGTDDSSGDEEEDDFDLEDDDTEFDVEDHDETAVEDETGEADDDSPVADRR